MTPDHVMVDLETADNVPTAAIVAIGAVVFRGPHAGLQFYRAVDLHSCLAAKLTMSNDTMAWWGKQSPEARAVFADPQRVPVLAALQEFYHFMNELNEVRVWGNGASFDNAILSNAYRAVGVPLPWKFWNDRCYRTVAAGMLQKRQQQGTYHNALDDAISQADHLIRYAPEAVV